PRSFRAASPQSGGIRDVAARCTRARRDGGALWKRCDASISPRQGQMAGADRLAGSRHVKRGVANRRCRCSSALAASSDSRGRFGGVRRASGVALPRVGGATSFAELSPAALWDRCRARAAGKLHAIGTRAAPFAGSEWVISRISRARWQGAALALRSKARRGGGRSC
ncbi:unnamed protein product, partial [Polarella glacialis]